MASSVAELARELEQLRNEQRAQATSAQLAYSSIEDGALRVRDADGTVRASWGTQYDGTVATVYTDGPTPGAPSAPTLIAHQLAVVVQWDGSFETGQAPLDLSHVEVHVSERVNDLGKFTPRLATLTGTLTPSGGALTFAGDNDTHYVCLVAVSTCGRRSDASDYQSVTPLPADVVMADELVGKIVTGGIVRTAARGARVELNANASTQNVRFISDRGDVAVIAQTDYTDLAGRLLGSGIALVSAEGADGTQSLLTLAPDTLGQWVIDATTGATLSSIEARSDLAQVRGGDYVVNVGADTGIQLNNAATGYYLWADANGTWRLKGNGDVGGPTGGLLKLFDTVDRGDGNSYFMELDVNEIQANPYAESLHLNLDSGSDVTLSGKLRAKGNANGTPMLATYGDPQGDVGLLFSATNSGILYVTKWDGTSRRPIDASNISVSSDPAMKADITALAPDAALQTVVDAPVYNYVMSGDETFTDRRGLMSTDLPDDIATRDPDSDSVDLYGLIATVWGAVQQLTHRMEALEG